MPDALGHRSREDVERAIASLEQQRTTLGDAVVDISIASLREHLGQDPRPESRADGERRTVLTALFADLEGFTELSRSLDPEDTRDIVERCFARWRESVERHGGVVEKYIGDAVLAVFGLHRSDEEDAARAVRAGREMVAALAEIADDVAGRYGIELHMRVGIDTGEVVVSTLDDRGGQGFVAVGSAVNRASRLQAVAPRDGVLISDATRRHVRGRFGFSEQPPLVLKGIEKPVVAYVALAERPAGFDLEPATGIGGVEVVTVGRELELLALQEHLADIAAESSWRVVTVVGEAGIGKSRLLRELDSWLAERPEGFWWLRGRAAPGARHRPHGVLRDVVSTRFRIAPDDPPATVLERTAAAMEAAFGPGPSAHDDAALLTRWLGFETTSGSATTDDPQTLNAQASELLARYVARLSEHAPVVMLMEDLHWADDASLAWLETADPLLSRRPVLVVATARPVFLADRAHWGEGLGYHARLTLSPLSRRHSRTLLEQLLHQLDDVPRDLANQLIDHAEGNPYYLEELVAWLVDTGVVTGSGESWTVRPDRLGALKVPSTLLGLLQARLDALPSDQRVVLQRAAVVGRVFWEDAVIRLADDDDDGEPDADVVGALEELRSSGLVQKRPMSDIESTPEYLFKHALLRDVAYESQLRSHRRTRHARVADWLIDVTAPSGRTEEVAALVAQHLDRAARPDASSWYLRAGRRAAAVYAVDEADRLLRRGLELADPGDAELRADLLIADESHADRRGDRERQLEDLEALAPLLDAVPVDRRIDYFLARARYGLATSAYADVLTWCDRAVADATEPGMEIRLAEAHLWAGKSLTWTADSEAAQRELGIAIEIAQRQGARSVEADAWRYLAMLASNEADYPRALELARRAQELFAQQDDLEGEATALMQLSITSYHLGRLGDARAFLEQSIPVFERAGRHYGQVIALSNLATITADQGELAQALAWSREALDLTEKLRDVEGAAVNTLAMAEIEMRLGRWSEALESARASEAVGRGVATNALIAMALAIQAACQSALGEHDEARTLAAAAVETSRTGPFAREEALALLHQGGVLLACGEAVAAATVFDEARAQFEDLGVTGFASQARAGAAESQRVLGHLDEAMGTLGALVDHLADADLEAADPDLVRLWCWSVLRDAGDPRADAVLEHARAALRASAGKVGDDAMAAEYLARPVAQALLQG